jgi:hypothetical protein
MSSEITSDSIDRSAIRYRRTETTNGRVVPPVVISIR